MRDRQALHIYSERTIHFYNLVKSHLLHKSDVTQYHSQASIHGTDILFIHLDLSFNLNSLWKITKGYNYGYRCSESLPNP